MKTDIAFNYLKIISGKKARNRKKISRVGIARKENIST